MFKKENRKFTLIFTGLMLIVIAVQYLLPRPTDLSRNYQDKNKSPFGCYAIYNLLDSVYSREVKVNSQTLYNLDQSSGAGTSLLIVNDKVDFNQNDVEYLFDFLRKGNTVMLAAGEFYGSLNDSLHLQTRSVFYSFSQPFDSLIKKPGVEFRFFSSNLRKQKFSYPQLAVANYFAGFDSSRCKVMAAIDKNKACLIKARVGKGTLYLMSMPDVFGNYFIAGHHNRAVAYNCLSLIKNKTLVWDEYYKTFNVNNYSPIKFILESDALYSAYLLGIFAIVAYMVFEGRRRQRAIPVIVPPENSTLEFINVISHVYYNNKNHRSIAVEKIKYFYESLRKKFSVNTAEINDRLYDEISELSGIDKKMIRQLFVFCERIKNAEEITEYELLELNRQIDNFNKNSLR
ncbi:MAG: DUF4350 domain-containing protein [Bacteroidota bacterium]